MIVPPILNTARDDETSPPSSCPDGAICRRRREIELTLLPSVNGATALGPSLEDDMTPREMVLGR
jgi:hypothetical protein